MRGVLASQRGVKQKAWQPVARSRRGRMHASLLEWSEVAAVELMELRQSHCCRPNTHIPVANTDGTQHTHTHTHSNPAQTHTGGACRIHTQRLNK